MDYQITFEIAPSSALLEGISQLPQAVQDFLSQPCVLPLDAGGCRDTRSPDDYLRVARFVFAEFILTDKLRQNGTGSICGIESANLLENFDTLWTIAEVDEIEDDFEDLVLDVGLEKLKALVPSGDLIVDAYLTSQIAIIDAFAED